MSGQIKKIAIIGRDLDAWVTAFFLKLVLDKAKNNFDIVLIDLGYELSEHDAYAVLPAYRILHQTLAANEDNLRRSALAKIYYGQKFSGWNPELPDFFHAYDRHGINFNGIDFFQYWMKARINGLKIPLDDFSLGVAAAKHRRHIPEIDETGFSHAAYGYHLSAREYVGAIARAATEAGVKRIDGEFKKANIIDDSIVSIELQDGSIIDADFYIDASGPESILINTLSDSNFESWDAWFHCDRIVSASSASLSTSTAFSQITAFSSGWCGMYSLANRTALHVLYSSKYADFNQVTEEIKKDIGVDVSGGVERKITCGILKRPWIGNCLAVGSTAAVLEPLDALQQYPLVISMVMLRQVFPGDTEYSNEREIYNKKMHLFIENLRDFQISHYKLNSRAEPFWVYLRNMEIPKALSEKISLFNDCGYISLREDETFQEENWTSIFNGHGLIPNFYSPLVDNISEDILMIEFKKILEEIKKRMNHFSAID